MIPFCSVANLLLDHSSIESVTLSTDDSENREVSRKVKPTVLIAASSHWIPTARLAMALTNAGCVVDAVCPARHPLTTVRAVRRSHRYSGLAPLYSLSQAIQDSAPDLIIPGDDLTTRHLHHLYRRERNR